MKLGIATFSLLILGCVSAFAEEHPIDMSRVLIEANGTPAAVCIEYDAVDAKVCKTSEPLTLGRAISIALLASFPDDQSLTGDLKWARGELGMRIRGSNAVALDSEEISAVKKYVGKFYGPAVIAQVFPLIDPNAKPPKLSQ